MATPERHEFQAEIRRVLDLVINSLYTEREVFLRELVSNASDALEKLRHTQLVEKEIFDDRLPAEVSVLTDDTARRLTITDHGIGMTREELITNLGTIARSGAGEFLDKLEEAARKDARLIGQFGVGFYSAFMVAKKVTVQTRSWHPQGQGWQWTSSGDGSFEIEAQDGLRRGTRIILDLKDDAVEFSRESRVREILLRYSNFIQFPILLNGSRLNTVQAIWTRPKAEIKSEEYDEFYKFLAGEPEAPRLRLHFAADAPLAIHALLFVPRRNLERLQFGRMEAQVQLYCRKVLIDSRPQDFLPTWLRFLRGVVDSDDLPLNISREVAQDRALLERVGGIIARRFVKFLEEEAVARPDEYADFFRDFGSFIREGVLQDRRNSAQIARLLRYESTALDAGKLTSLAEYVGRMREGQKSIYVLVSSSRSEAERGPYLEAFRARGLEVLLAFEPADAVVLSQLGSFDGKAIERADDASVELPDAPAPAGEALPREESEALCAFLREVLGARVQRVSTGTRLVDSPVAVLDADAMMSGHVRRMLRALRPEDDPGPLRVALEINPRHPLIRRLGAVRTTQPEVAKLAAEHLLDNALAAAGLLEEPAALARRSFQILERALSGQS